MAFDKESKTKVLSLTSADSLIKNNLIYDFRVEISFMPNGKQFDFRKTSFRYYGFLVAIIVCSVFL